MPLTATRHRRRCSDICREAAAAPSGSIACHGRRIPPSFRVRHGHRQPGTARAPDRCDLIETSAKIAKTHGRTAPASDCFRLSRGRKVGEKSVVRGVPGMFAGARRHRDRFGDGQRVIRCRRALGCSRFRSGAALARALPPQSGSAMLSRAGLSAITIEPSVT